MVAKIFAGFFSAYCCVENEYGKLTMLHQSMVISQKRLKSGTHWQQSRLSPIRSTLWPVLATNRQQFEFDSLPRSTLLPIWSTSSPVCTGPKQRARLVDFEQSPPCWIQLCRQCVPGFSGKLVIYNITNSNSYQVFWLTTAAILTFQDLMCSRSSKFWLAPQDCIASLVASSLQTGQLWAILTAAVNVSLLNLRSSRSTYPSDQRRTR